MSYTAKKGKAQERSDVKNCRRFVLKLTRSTDADIIALLENKENKQGYIKRLIRRDLEQKWPSGKRALIQIEGREEE